MYRKALIKMNQLDAGILAENENGYSFQYKKEYLNSSQAKAISLTIPLRESSYESNTLFPFFDGLIPEGWLLDIVEKNWKINERDRMGLLLACCKNCIGAVSVEPIEE